MSWSRPRTLTQTYTIEMEHSEFFERIAELIAEAIDTEVDNQELNVEEVNEDGAFFTGNYTCDYRTWYSPQTMWEPEEYEVEREYISDGKDNKWIKNLIVKHAEELVSLIDFKLEEDEDAVSIESDYDD